MSYPSRRSAGQAGLLSAALCLVSGASAQIDTQPTEGLRDNTPRVHALTGARVFVTPTTVIDSATLVLRDGIVDAVGADIDVPPDAKIWPLEGRIVYPGFIDAMSELGLPDELKPPRRPPTPGQPEQGPSEPPAEPATGYWNARIHPETDVAALLELDAEAVEALRELGITAALSVPRRGILRGRSALVLTGASDNARLSVLAAAVAQHAGAEMSQRTTSDEYPTSLMGVIALLRQAFYDAQWYRDMGEYYAQNPDVERAAPNSALAALAPLVDRAQPLVYATDDELDYERALAIGAEFGLDLALYGNGHEYRKTSVLTAVQRPIVVPLDFPEPPDVASPDRALGVSLEELQHWELAPSNAAFLARAGIPFAFTADGMDDPKQDFWKNVRLAGKRGLTTPQSLAALTTAPAELLGMSDSLGTLERGKIANVVVADADLFTDDEAAIELVFVDGRPFELEAYRAVDPEGRWDASWPTGAGRWAIERDDARLTLSIGDREFRGSVDDEQIVLYPAADVFGGDEGLARLAAFLVDGALEGVAELPDGATFVWRAAYAGALEEDGPDSEEAESGEEEQIPDLAARPYPAGAFGLAARPAAPAALLVRGATVWTGTSAPMESADVLVRDGRIAAVGRDLELPRDTVIMEATGKHITPGLIDAHSHTAISRGVNEAGSAVTVEVRIADVLNPTDIGIYRELAGGLTAANVMHGSANPMGGQTQTIKLRWGEDAAGLEFAGAPAGVKFALGENVKQSNWGDRFTTRYPQTRMGVEQIIRDTLVAAQRYGDLRANRGRRDPPVRRNLRLDAALEILNDERHVHIHSYRQDEILAFVRLAQEYGLSVAAFQHALEGYKVADAIAEIGAGGSTFSDWWAYKFEVIDAIPYNGALMHRAGVVTSFNSDDDELATRLNSEAAKAVKYGGLSEEEALRFVTVNPAIQLGIDDRVGSLEPGKDADFVIWSGPPLSAFSRAEQVWIDGRKYFDIEVDRAMRQAAVAERARIIQKILAQQLSSEGPSKGGASGTEGRAAGRRKTDVYSSAHHQSHAKDAGVE